MRWLPQGAELLLVGIQCREGGSVKLFTVCVCPPPGAPRKPARRQGGWADDTARSAKSGRKVPDEIEDKRLRPDTPEGSEDGGGEKLLAMLLEGWGCGCTGLWLRLWLCWAVVAVLGCGGCGCGCGGCGCGCAGLWWLWWWLWLWLCWAVVAVVVAVVAVVVAVLDCGGCGCGCGGCGCGGCGCAGLWWLWLCCGGCGCGCGCAGLCWAVVAVLGCGGCAGLWWLWLWLWWLWPCCGGLCCVRVTLAQTLMSCC
uniref:Uncharacterized protein n=1 Tax=Callorhinchus milii TaxID=7868 RepID=A0A4W3H0Y9_CALMI